MKKLLFSLLAIGGYMQFAAAAPGDTTIVYGHDLQKLSWYENYDTSINYPNSGVRYQKILMEFTLGKYNCGGSYNPANAGEISQGGTGWCADWDYDLHIISMMPNGDTFKLGEVITPYANSTLPHMPWTWTRKYTYDVTDFYPVLRGPAHLRIFYAGWSGGFTGSVKFIFIEGEPPREVLAVKPLWLGSYEYGVANNPIDSQIKSINITPPANAASASLRTLISGHGMAAENCAEFCNKYFQLHVNNQSIDQKDIWKSNCGYNETYPQSGTWIYDRSNWCPGEAVMPYHQEIPVHFLGSPFDIDLAFQPYTNSTSSGASYKVGSTLFFYGRYRNNIDAGLENIVSPSTDNNFYRNNPICGSPKIRVKNYGETAINSLDIEYGIDGASLHTYQFTGNIDPNETIEIDLPMIAEIKSATSAGTFKVKLGNVNGATDFNLHNNELESEFVPAQIWDGGKFAISMRTTPSIQGFQNLAIWKIIDETTGAVVATRNGNANSTTYNDTVQLQNGCYKFELDCSALGIGLRNIYLTSTAGFLRLTNLKSGTRINLEKNRDGQTSAYQGNLDGWVGSGFTERFVVTNANISIKETGMKAGLSMNVYPNPAQTHFNIKINVADKNSVGQITMINSLGAIVWSKETKDKEINISTKNFAKGIYTVQYQSGTSLISDKIVIE